MFSVEGFGHHVSSDKIKLGQVVLISRGELVWIAMRVGYDATDVADLALAQLRGDPIAGVYFPRTLAPNAGRYTTIQGEVVLRPAAFALPAADGLLVVDGRGEAFIRKVVDGVEHFAVATGLAKPPADERTYFADWELVHVVGDTERVITTSASRPAEGS